jgi:DNA-3-methyladenine glycosylase
MRKLMPEFFKQDTLVVAKELLGKVISINGFKVRIVETEAYGQDEASHAFKRTDRSALMYDTHGHIYVYLIYGMYNCLNFTTEPKGVPGAVLIRAVEPLVGMDMMKKNRKIEIGSLADKVTNLCSGPGKLCQALGVDRSFNGLKVGDEVSGKGVNIYDDGFSVGRINSSSRVGIKDAKHLEWRFYLDSEFVSKV